MSSAAEEKHELPKIDNLTIEEFTEACKTDSADVVTELLKQKNVSLDAAFPNGEILLRVAVKATPNSEIVKALLNLGGCQFRT